MMSSLFFPNNNNINTYIYTHNIIAFERRLRGGGQKNGAPNDDDDDDDFLSVQHRPKSDQHQRFFEQHHQSREEWDASTQEGPSSSSVRVGATASTPLDHRRIVLVIIIIG
jgi:hypothetical protein